MKLKKFRQKYDKFVVEGYKTALEFIKSGKYQIISVYVTHDANINDVDLMELEVDLITQREMDQLSMFKTSSEILVLAKMNKNPEAESLRNKATIIYLDRIQDPGNLGTIIRTVDWFGVDALVVSSDSADFYNPKTIAASMGSICGPSLYRIDFDKLRNICERHQVIGTMMAGQNLYEYSFPEKGILVLGNEGQGISDQIIAQLDDSITIPGVQNRIAESLNVAIATSIICSQWKLKIS